MKSLEQLTGRARRRCMRLLRIVREEAAAGFNLHVRHEHQFRDAERLHRAGLLTILYEPKPRKHLVAPYIHSSLDRPFHFLSLFADEVHAIVERSARSARSAWIIPPRQGRR